MSEERLKYFCGYWENDLLVRIENIEKIERVGQVYDKKFKNPMINALINDYKHFSINHILLKFFETLELIGKLDPEWSTKNKNERKGMPKELKKVISFRNKLVAHVEENKGTELYLILRKESPKILDIIKRAYGLIELKLNELGVKQIYANSLIAEFEEEQLVRLGYFENSTD